MIAPKMAPMMAPTPRKLALACALAVLAVVSGCAHKAPIEEPMPSVEMPAGWTLGGKAGDQEWPDNDWWKRFGSAELSQLVDQGQKSNLEIAAALSRVRQAETRSRIAGASLLPSADFSTSAYRDLPIANTGSANTSANSMLYISYEVDFWGKNKASLAAAQA